MNVLVLMMYEYILTLEHRIDWLVLTRYAPALQPMHDLVHAASSYVLSGHCRKIES